MAQQPAQRILVVDDEADMRNFIRNALSSQGYDVEEAGNGRDAIALFKARPCDLVITDLKMPVMDGIELLDHLHNMAPDVMVVIITGYGTVEVAVRALQQGAYNFLTKPFNIAQLLTVVQKGLEHRRLLDMDALVVPYMSKVLRFQIPTDPRFIKGIGSRILQSAEEMGFVATDSDRMSIQLAVDEALSNAIEHGNKGDPQKQIRVECTATPESVEITVEDEGGGFCLDALPDPTAPENLMRTCGRGIFLIRCYMDKVTFNPRGNRITMIKRRQKGDPSRPLLGESRSG